METEKKVELAFKEDVFVADIKGKNHNYTLNGKKLTGVTTILGVIDKPALIPWAARMATDYIKENLSYKRIKLLRKGYVVVRSKVIDEATTAWQRTRDTAGEAGKDVHAILEDIITEAIQKTGGYIETDSHENKQVDNFLKWARANTIKFLESEKSVYSKSLWFGGTLDFLYEKDSEVYVGDIKTSSAIYPINYWQCSAYQFCLQEMGLYPKIKGFTIVRCGKDGKFEIGENYAYEDNISGFQSALNIYRKINLISKK